MMFQEHRLAKIGLIIFFLLLIGYAYYEARAMLYGPQIQVPSETIMVSEPHTQIRGQASYISELRLNGGTVHVTEDGKFAEELLLAPGENRLIFDAKDKFGRETQEVVTVYYKPTNDPSPPPIPQATTTETTTQSDVEEITE